MTNKIPTFTVLNLLVNALIQFDDQRFQSEFDILKKDLDSLEDTDLVPLTHRLDDINEYITECLQAIATAHADDGMLLGFNLDDDDPALRVDPTVVDRRLRLERKREELINWVDEVDQLLRKIEDMQ